MAKKKNNIFCFELILREFDFAAERCILAPVKLMLAE